LGIKTRIQGDRQNQLMRARRETQSRTNGVKQKKGDKAINKTIQGKEQQRRGSWVVNRRIIKAVDRRRDQGHRGKAGCQAIRPHCVGKQNRKPTRGGVWERREGGEKKSKSNNIGHLQDKTLKLGRGTVFTLNAFAIGGGHRHYTRSLQTSSLLTHTRFTRRSSDRNKKKDIIFKKKNRRVKFVVRG